MSTYAVIGSEPAVHEFNDHRPNPNGPWECYAQHQTWPWLVVVARSLKGTWLAPLVSSGLGTEEPTYAKAKYDLRTGTATP
jgi:hypothetical protein